MAGDVGGRIVAGSPAVVIIEDLLVKELVEVADVMLAAMVAALWGARARHRNGRRSYFIPRLSRLESIEERKFAGY